MMLDVQEARVIRGYQIEQLPILFHNEAGKRKRTLTIEYGSPCPGALPTAFVFCLARLSGSEGQESSLPFLCLVYAVKMASGSAFSQESALGSLSTAGRTSQKFKTGVASPTPSGKRY